MTRSIAALAGTLGVMAGAVAMPENYSEPGPFNLMFIMDVPYTPAQQTPIVLAQAAALTAGTTPQPDYILKICKETVSIGDPRSAMRAVDPAGMFAIYLQNHNNRTVDAEMLAAIKTTLLEGTTHGQILSATSNYGRTTYHYDAEPNYVGKDRAVFMAEFEGKRYKIVLDLRVFIGIDENNPTCPPPNSSRSMVNLCLAHQAMT